MFYHPDAYANVNLRFPFATRYSQTKNVNLIKQLTRFVDRHRRTLIVPENSVYVVVRLGGSRKNVVVRLQKVGPKFLGEVRSKRLRGFALANVAFVDRLAGM